VLACSHMNPRGALGLTRIPRRNLERRRSLVPQTTRGSTGSLQRKIVEGASENNGGKEEKESGNIKTNLSPLGDA